MSSRALPHRLLAGLVAVIACLVLPGLASAAPGDLDGTFGAGGKVAESIQTEVEAVVPVGDGKVVLAGRYLAPNGVRGMWASRRTADGARDATFGDPGGDSWAVVTYGDLGCDDVRAQDAVRSPDGGLLLAGSCETINGRELMAVTRLTPAGRPDGGFGQGGRVLIPFDSDPGDDRSSAQAIALNAAGTQAIVAGQASVRLTDGTSLRGMAFAAINPATGALDSRFGTGGRRVVTFATRNCLEGEGVARQESVAMDVLTAPDGKISASGTLQDRVEEGSAGGFRNAGVVQLLADGSLDPDFKSVDSCNDAGRRFLSYGSANSSDALTRLSNGDLLIGMQVDGEPILAYTPGSSTSSKGSAESPRGVKGSITALSTDSDGRPIVAGWEEVSGDWTPFVERRRAFGGNGLDSTFGQDGRVLVPFDREAKTSALALDEAGRIVIGATANPVSGRAARLLTSDEPTPDPTPTPTPSPTPTATPGPTPTGTPSPTPSPGPSQTPSPGPGPPKVVPPPPPAVFRTLDSTVTRVLPRVRGKRIDAARDAISKAGIPADFEIRYRSSNKDTGDVIDMRPSAGKPVKGGVGQLVDVRLTVSSGPDLPAGAPCPIADLKRNLKKADYDVALALLKRAGCKVGDVTIKPVGGDVPAEVGKLSKDGRKGVDLTIRQSKVPAENDLFLNIKPSRVGLSLSADSLRLQAVSVRGQRDASQENFLLVQVIDRAGRAVPGVKLLADTQAVDGPGKVQVTTGANGEGTLRFAAGKAGTVDIVASYTGTNNRTIYGYAGQVVEKPTLKKGQTLTTAAGLVFERTDLGFKRAAKAAAATAPRARATSLGGLWQWVTGLFSGGRVPEVQKAAATAPTEQQKLEAISRLTPYTPSVLVTTPKPVGAGATEAAKITVDPNANAIKAGGNVVAVGGANVVAVGGDNVQALSKGGELLVNKSTLLSDNKAGLAPPRGEIVTLLNGSSIIGTAAGNAIAPSRDNLFPVSNKLLSDNGLGVVAVGGDN